MHALFIVYSKCVLLKAVQWSHGCLASREMTHRHGYVSIGEAAKNVPAIGLHGLLQLAEDALHLQQEHVRFARRCIFGACY